MAVMDEFKEERERMKQQPLKKRLAYFWDYHKVPILITLVVVFMGASLLHSIFSKKDIALWVALIDCNSNEATTGAYKEELMNLMGLDPATQEIYLDNSFVLTGLDTMEGSNAETLSLRIMAGEIDAFVAPEDVFNRYVQNGIFRDLREILTQEQLTYFADSFYYVDYAVIESGAIYTQDFAQTQFVDNADHTSPDGMEKPIPVGIYVTGTEEFQGHYYFKKDQTVVIGIPYYSQNVDRTMIFLNNMIGRE